MNVAEDKIWKEYFKIFYQKYSQGFWYFILKICGDENMADDIFQESLFKFIKAAPVKLNEYQQKSYLYKIATRLIIDQRRKLQIEKKYLLEGYREQKNENLLAAIDMEKIFALLKPKEKTMVWLAYIEEYSHKEIADMMSIKEKGIRVQLHRIRRKVAEKLKKMEFEGKNYYEEKTLSS